MKREPLNLNDYDYALPPELIAKHPAPRRDACRLLVVERQTQVLSHRQFSDLPKLLNPGDLLVVNDTKVIPARLFARRKTGGRVELLLHRLISGNQREALLQPAAKIRVGEKLSVSPKLTITVVKKLANGRACVDLHAAGELDKVLGEIGHIPLPPYLRRPDQPRDRHDYQTIFARVPGAVAAPTAGLHFTPELLRQLAARDIATTAVTLQVGLGTFQPLRDENLRTGKLHPERYEIPPATAAAITKTKAAGGRVVAVGTTVVRALEQSTQRHAGNVRAGRGETQLFITPGFHFKIADALITNFHLPRSSLLLLVCAFAGRELALRAYREAIGARYRFYSYGGAMLIW